MARADPGEPLRDLVQRGVPAVIGMQFDISDEAAGVLAAEFYRALVDGLKQRREAGGDLPGDVQHPLEQPGYRAPPDLEARSEYQPRVVDVPERHLAGGLLVEIDPVADESARGSGLRANEFAAVRLASYDRGVFTGRSSHETQE